LIDHGIDGGIHANKADLKISPAHSCKGWWGKRFEVEKIENFAK